MKCIRIPRSRARRHTRRAPAGVAVGLAVAAAAGVVAAPASADLPAGSFGFDGAVNAIARADGHTYVGGRFGAAKQLTGGGIIVSADGNGGPIAGQFPRIAGRVSAAVADGAGGWIVGGAFTRVGDVAVRNLAHIDADGHLDASWRPDPDAPVQSLSRVGNEVLVVGGFDMIGGRQRDQLARVRIADGTTTDWDPGAVSGTVWRARVAGQYVVVEGSFGDIAGGGSSGFALLDLQTGAVEPVAPHLDGYISDVAVEGQTLYLAGAFTTIDGQARGGLAAIDLTDGQPTAWNPATAGSEVYDLRVTEEGVYVAGSFSQIGGATRANLALLSPATGLAQPWNPSADGRVLELELAGDRVYVAGYFEHVGGQPRKTIAEIDRASGAVTGWDAKLGDYVELDINEIIPAGDTIYLRGLFDEVGGQPRNDIAAVSATDGTVRAWNPQVGGSVDAVALSAGRVLVGGDFTTAGPPLVAIGQLARLDSAGNLDTDWHPAVVGRVVNGLVVADGALVVGGSFSKIGGAQRTGLAKLDLATGAPTGWAPQLQSGAVDLMSVSGNVVYIHGEFIGSVAGAARYGAAAVDLTTGQPTPWFPAGAADWFYLSALQATPGAVYLAKYAGAGPGLQATDPSSGATLWSDHPTGSIYELEMAGGALWASGSFSKIGGKTIAGFAALTPMSGAPTAWRPPPATTTGALTAAGSTLYAAQSWSDQDGGERSGVIALDASSGAATGWKHELNGGVSALIADGPTLYMAGGFTTVDGRFTGPYAQVPIPLIDRDPVPRPDPAADDPSADGDNPAPGPGDPTPTGGGTSPSGGGQPMRPAPSPTPPVRRGRAPSGVGITLATGPAAVSAGRFALQIRCGSTRYCRGTATATAQVASRPHARTVTVARAAINVAAGKEARLQFALTAAGRNLLRPGTRRLRATVVVVIGGRTVARRRLTLTPARR